MNMSVHSSISSYIDCSNGLLLTRKYRQCGEIDCANVPDKARNLNESDIYNMPIDKNPGVQRNFTNTVTKQITVARVALSVTMACEAPNSADVINARK